MTVQLEDMSFLQTWCGFMSDTSVLSLQENQASCALIVLVSRGPQDSQGCRG